MKLVFGKILLLLAVTAGSVASVSAREVSKPRTIYMTYLLHGNMNYDRYTKSTIWRDFPVIYDKLLDFIESHPEFKGQIQLSGQTFLSLKQTAPHVLDHARRLHQKGQLNFTGTFYSEPLNVSMDGETNLRCARLGTSIIEKETGSTDGFMLQENAYHVQLPWILNNARISWVPTITGDDIFLPFKLKGLDGSMITCVPVFHMRKFKGMIAEMPENSLLLTMGDYEIPQGFISMYEQIRQFNKESEEIKIEWITVKEYLEKFVPREEKTVDNIVRNEISNGYARWTADPLDIVVQDFTNHAMSDFRAASMLNSLVSHIYGQEPDPPFSLSGITPIEDPVAWDVEQAADYPEVEPEYLARKGKITLLTKAEHLILWGVNSDARGWYPLYERRMERINSFRNSSALSREVITRGLDLISQRIPVKGYDKYTIIFNAEPAREKMITFEADKPYDLYEYNGNKLKSTLISKGGKIIISSMVPLPGYGYQVIGMKKSDSVKEYPWKKGNTIGNGNLKISVEEGKILVRKNGTDLEMSLDSFKLKALAEMTGGIGDDQWRDAVPYGKWRISVRETIYPQLRIQHQPDWLIHMEQTFTLLPDRVICDVSFTFPHPTVLRKSGKPADFESGFNPEGLKILLVTKNSGEVLYNIPFGIAPYNSTKPGNFCALNSVFFQSAENGFVVSTRTGEQGFQTNPEEGTLGIFLGASTTSGPIRNVGMEFISETSVKHDPAWYAEPFHGTYHHQFMLHFYDGNWQQNHAPTIARSYTEEVYIREFEPGKSTDNSAPRKSLAFIDPPEVEITSLESGNNGLLIRINEKENKDTDVKLTIGRKTKNTRIRANGIATVEF